MTQKGPNLGCGLRGPGQNLSTPANWPTYGIAPSVNVDVIHFAIIGIHTNALAPTGLTISQSYMNGNPWKAVQAVRAYNATSPTVLQGLRMRIEMGQYYTSALLNGLAAAGPFQDNQSPPNSWHAPPWWDESNSFTINGVAGKGKVAQAYAQLMQALAQYTFPDGNTIDSTPEIREITPCLCMQKTDEVYFRYAGTGSNNTAYSNAGYTSAHDYDQLKFQIAIMASLFPNTIIHLDLNVFDTVTDNNGFASALAFTQDTVDYGMGVGAYSTLISPGLCVTNASLQSSGNAPLYADMMNRGPLGTGDATRNDKCAVSFQTYQEPTVNVGNLQAVLDRAIGFGATSVEVIDPFGTDTYTTIGNAIRAGSPNRDQKLINNLPATAHWPWQGTQAPPTQGVPVEYPAGTAGPGGEVG